MPQAKLHVAITYTERVIRRNTNTQLPDVRSYKGNPQAEVVNIFLLNSHTQAKLHAVVTCTERSSYKEINTHSTDNLMLSILLQKLYQGR